MIGVHPLRDAAERYRQSVRSLVIAAVRSHFEEPSGVVAQLLRRSRLLINKTQRSGPLGCTTSKIGAYAVREIPRVSMWSFDFLRRPNGTHVASPQTLITHAPAALKLAAPSSFHFRETFQFFTCNCCKSFPFIFRLSFNFCRRNVSCKFIRLSCPLVSDFMETEKSVKSQVVLFLRN